MDFRKCPACQASVLEDDVDDCPFCGASMSGKPKPAGSSPKASATSEKKTTGSATPKSTKQTQSGKPNTSAKKAPEKKSPDEDDPFEVDTSAVRKALRLSPRPTKTRTYEIVCPMCETKGYIVPQDAGKDVQCVNSECVVPVFKSKRPKVEAPVVEEKKSKKGLIIGVSVAAIAVIGFGLFTIMTPPENPGTTGGGNGGGGGGGPIECDECPVEQVCDDCKPEAITLVEIRKQSLKKVFDSIRDKGRHDKNVASQVAIVTSALAGEIDDARSQLKRLQSSGRVTSYLQLQPYSEIAWAQLKAGNKEGATKSATDALIRAKNLPPNVRHSLDSATSLAAVLVAVGKKEEAKQFVREQFADAERNLGSRGDASVLWRAALDSHTYDIGLEASRPYHIVMPEALRMGVVETLVAHGFPDEAWSVIESATSVDSKDACRAAWAGRLAEMKPESVTATLTQAITAEGTSPTGKARAWSAVASHLKTKKLDDPAKAALDLAIAAAGEIAAPKPEKTLSMKQIYESAGKSYLGLSDSSQEESSALACADIAIVCMQFNLADQSKEFMEKSMAYARATTPSPVLTQHLFDECQTREATVRSQLQNSLNKNGNELRIAFNRYRRQCERLNKMASDRFAFQVKVLRSIAKTGLVQPVWEFAATWNGKSEISEREAYFNTSLPGLLIILSDLNGHDKLKSDISVALGRPPKIDKIDGGIGTVKQLLKKNDLEGAAEYLRGFIRSSAVRSDRNRADIELLGVIADVQQSRSITETFEFLITTSDPIIKQDGFLLFAAYTVQAGTAPTFWDLLNTPAIRELGALEKIAVFRGFVTGISNKKSNSASSSSVEAPEAE